MEPVDTREDELRTDPVAPMAAIGLDIDPPHQWIRRLVESTVVVDEGATV